MKTKKTNRVLAVALAVFMAISMLAVSAFAITENTGTINVSGAEAGVTVNAYKIIDVQYDYTVDQPSEPLFKWVPAVADWVKANYPAYINAADNSVTDNYTDSISKEDAASFYDDLASAIRSGKISLDASATAVAGAEGNAALTALPMANYLVLIENGMKVYRPSAVNLIPTWKVDKWVMTDATVELKSSDSGISKKVVEKGSNDAFNDTASAGIGEKVTFEITVDIPKYPVNSINKTFSVSDTLPAELTYDASSIVVTANDGTVLEEGTAYTIGTARPGNFGTATFVIDFVYDKISAYSKVTVSYDATVNKEAKPGSGMINDANLDYANNPYNDSSYKTVTDKATVYTFGINLLKHEKGKEDVVLKGAQFNLSADKNNSSPIAVIKIADGEYRIAEAGEAGSTTVLVSNENGNINVAGLDEGVWYLTEIKAPDGYVKLSTPVVVTIEAEKGADGNLTGKVITEGGADASGIVSVKVANRTGFILPPTGGVGTIIFTVFGILIAAAGVFVIVKCVRKKRIS